MKTGSSITYDALLAKVVDNNREYGTFFFYKDWSDYYKDKFPKVEVKAVVVQQTIRIGAITYF